LHSLASSPSLISLVKEVPLRVRFCRKMKSEARKQQKLRRSGALRGVERHGIGAEQTAPMLESDEEMIGHQGVSATTEQTQALCVHIFSIVYIERVYTTDQRKTINIFVKGSWAVCKVEYLKPHVCFPGNRAAHGANGYLAKPLEDTAPASATGESGWDSYAADAGGEWDTPRSGDVSAPPPATTATSAGPPLPSPSRLNSFTSGYSGVPLVRISSLPSSEP
jgi:hypothetical protein